MQTAWQMPVLSKRALEGLRTYQYKPAGYTVLDDWHQPFWNCTLLRTSLLLGCYACRSATDAKRAPSQCTCCWATGCTERLPRWLAPNLITLTGLFGLVLAYVVSWAYLPSMEGAAPPAQTTL